MAFAITITEDAERQLRSLSAREQRIVEGTVQAKLGEDPATPTHAIKRLRPNPFCSVELRMGDLRAFV